MWVVLGWDWRKSNKANNKAEKLNLFWKEEIGMVTAAAITAVKLLAGAVVIAVTGASGAGIIYAVRKRSKKSSPAQD